MTNKSLIQIIVLILIILSSYIVGKNFFYEDTYLEKPERSKPEDKVVKKEKKEIEKKLEHNLIESLQYRSLDSLGNEYLINCKSAVTKSNSENILDMVEVNAIVYIKNKKPIYINSDYATYDKDTFNTNFFGNVKIVNDLTKIFSENLDLIYEDNLVNLYNIKEIFYDKTKLIADNVRFNLLTKDININMNDENKKIDIYLR